MNVKFFSRTLIHPKLSNNIYNDVYPIDISVLEQLPRDAISKDEGVKAVPIDDNVQNGTSKTKSFYWRKVCKNSLLLERKKEDNFCLLL